MRIWLVRHGRPDIDDASAIRGSEFRAWVDAYDDAPLDLSVEPSQVLGEIAAGAGCIVTSTLRRSLESAQVLDSLRSPISESGFREAEIPGVPFQFHSNPQRWAVVARVAWVLGWSPGVETFSQARRRAKTAAVRLESLAAENGSVMLVAHGMINGFIGRALRKRDWNGPSSLGGDYWAHFTFEKKEGRDGRSESA